VTVQTQRTSSIIVYTLARERRQHGCRSHRVMHGGRWVVKRLAPIALVLLTALLAGCLGPPAGYGSISVVSEPQGARIFLDDRDTAVRRRPCWSRYGPARMRSGWSWKATSRRRRPYG